MKQYYVYIIGNRRPTLYIGVTDDIVKRIWQHKNKVVDGFSKQYNLTSLLYYEAHPDPTNAINREKQIKKWKREWKLNLIKSINPTFKDLYLDLPG